LFGRNRARANLSETGECMASDFLAVSPRRRLKAAVYAYLVTPFHKAVITPLNIRKNAGRTFRRLEIGPGSGRIRGFETLNIVANGGEDYVSDAGRHMPFADNTFDIVYASHIIEHVPWYQTERALAEWVRVLKPGGWLEIWVPDGLKIARAFVNAEDAGEMEFHKDGWWRLNDRHDPCVWMSGRCFSYGDGTGRASHPNWHRALFSERLLREMFSRAGLEEIVQMEHDEVRGQNHGWINLGVKGRKP